MPSQIQTAGLRSIHIGGLFERLEKGAQRLSGEVAKGITSFVELCKNESTEMDEPSDGGFAATPHAHHYDQRTSGSDSILIMNQAAIEQLRNELDRIIDLSKRKPALAEGHVHTVSADGCVSTMRIKIVHLEQDFQRLPVPNEACIGDHDKLNPEHIVG